MKYLNKKFSSPVSDGRLSEEEYGVAVGTHCPECKSVLDADGGCPYEEYHGVCPECGHSLIGDRSGRCVVPGCNCEASRPLFQPKNPLNSHEASTQADGFAEESFENEGGK